MANNFGIYTFGLKKDAPHNPSIKSYREGVNTKNTFMIGEVNLTTSKGYHGKSPEEACKKRVIQEMSPKKGFEAFDWDDVVDFKVYTVISDKKSHLDTDIRNFICNNFPGAEAVDYKSGDKRGTTTEFITNLSRSELDKALEAFTQNNPDLLRTLNFELRDYQKAPYQKAAELLKSRNRVLLHLSTRFGKSFVSLELAIKELKAKNILIITPYPSAVDSFRDVAEHNVNYAGYRFFQKNDLSSTLKLGDRNAVMVSWQLLTVDDSKEKLNNLFTQVNFDAIILDEIHTASDSFRSTEVLKYITTVTCNEGCKQLWLSGTPYNDILSNSFNPGEIVTFDFIDMLNWDKSHRNNNFPELNINLVSNMERLNEVMVAKRKDLFEKEEQFSFNSIFKGGNSGNKTKIFFDWLFRDYLDRDKAENEFEELDEINDRLISSRNVFDGEHNKHCIFFLPSVNSCNLTKKALNDLFKSLSETSPLKKYVVTKVSGDTDKESSLDDLVNCRDVEKEINQFEAENEYTIVLSCNKLTTGVTLKRSDSVFIFKTLNSAERFVQISFRPMTKYPGKKVANIYCFDSEMVLKVVSSEIASKKSNDNYTTAKQVIEQFINCINFKALWREQEMEFLSNPVNYFLENTRKLSTHFNNEEVLSMDASFYCNKEILDLLAGMSSSDNLRQLIIASGLGGNEIAESKDTDDKTTLASDASSEEDDEQVKEKKNIKTLEQEVRDKISLLTRHLDRIIILNNIKRVKDFDDLEFKAEDLLDTEDNRQWFRDNEASINKLLKNIIKLNRQKMNQFIEDFRYNFEKAGFNW